MFVLNMLLGWGKQQLPRGEQKGVWLRRSAPGKAGQANHSNKTLPKRCSWLGFFLLLFSPFFSSLFLTFPLPALAGSLRGGER